MRTLKQRPSGLVTVEDEKPAPSAPKKPVGDFRVVHYGGIGTVMKFLDHMRERGVELVSIARGGSCGSGIVLDQDKRGYVVTYFHHEDLCVGEPT